MENNGGASKRMKKILKSRWTPRILLIVVGLFNVWAAIYGPYPALNGFMAGLCLMAVVDGFMFYSVLDDWKKTNEMWGRFADHLINELNKPPHARKDAINEARDQISWH